MILVAAAEKARLEPVAELVNEGGSFGVAGVVRAQAHRRGAKARRAGLLHHDDIDGVVGFLELQSRKQA